ncbi:hypothetical protein F6476_22775 [Pseudomonas umsongensis]|uniref:hypothetical protein n=1 Tax=Pseudomonas umsongensis TaxID=198618 RepID=UPI0012462FBC|nr:hypothetical protein [Pseudomonas umsongensis]QFG31795.1 hypothetical protein F6476_22775 [Pseudomonas umsongensis]
MEIEYVKDVFTIIGVVVTAVALVLAVLEYRQQGAQKRVEAYFNIERTLWSEKVFQEINELLLAGGDSELLAKIPLSTKLEYLGIYEEIALMLNSKLIKEDVAHYMFGYLAIKCYESKPFWVGENKDDIYWSLLGDFVTKMKHIEEEFIFDRRKLRF